MKDIKGIIYKIILILVACSTIINFMYCERIILWGFVLLGFIMIMICSITLNSISIKERKEELPPMKKSPLLILLTAVICIAWVISFCMTFSSK